MQVGQQVFIAAILIAFFGILSTQAYYATFGIEYYFLDIPIQHIIYRAIALIKYDPWMILPYLAMVFVLAFDEAQIPLKLGRVSISSKLYTYPLLIGILVWGWLLSVDAGVRLAVDQMDPRTTSLRQLSAFDSADAEKQKGVAQFLAENDVVLILVRTQSELITFSAPCFRATRPQLRLFHVRLAENDSFEHTPRKPISAKRPGCPDVVEP
jgi:hypothetical protein